MHVSTAQVGEIHVLATTGVGRSPWVTQPLPLRLHEGGTGHQHFLHSPRHCNGQISTSFQPGDWLSPAWASQDYGLHGNLLWEAYVGRV